MDCVLAKDTDNNNARKFLLATEDNVYSTSNSTNLLRNFIAVHNKVTNKVKWLYIIGILAKLKFVFQIRLVEFEECSVLSQHYDVVQKKPTAAVRSKEDSKKILLSAFGSKKANLMLDRIEKMKMNVDVVKEQLDKTMNSKILC